MRLEKMPKRLSDASESGEFVDCLGLGESSDVKAKDKQVSWRVQWHSKSIKTKGRILQAQSAQKEVCQALRTCDLNVQLATGFPTGASNERTNALQ